MCSFDKSPTRKMMKRMTIAEKKTTMMTSEDEGEGEGDGYSE